MKASSIRLRFAFMLFLLLVTLLTGGCRHVGCTDEKALNYNSVANHDDGSCLYCNSNFSEANLELSIVDDNSFSLFYNQVVAKAYLHSKKTDFSFDQCGTDTCRIYYQIQNLTNKRMTFNYNFIFGNFSSSLNQYVDISQMNLLRRTACYLHPAVHSIISVTS